MNSGLNKLAMLSLCAVFLPELSLAGKKYKFADKPSFEEDFSKGWNARQTDWKVNGGKQNGTMMSPSRCKANSRGYLVQTVLPGKPYRGGSMETRGEFSYGRWVARLKTSSVPGVLNSMFTMDWDDRKTPEANNDGSKTEVDIEFLTYTYSRKRGEVHLAVHLPGQENVEVADVPLRFNPSTDFHEWGFDILPDRVIWHVDGEEIHKWKGSKSKTLAPAYEMFFNSWTKPHWINGSPKEAAEYWIDWIRFYPLLAEDE